MEVECQGCHKMVELRLSQHRKKTPFLRCECGYLGFYNGLAGEKIRKQIDTESHKKKEAGWL